MKKFFIQRFFDLLDVLLTILRLSYSGRQCKSFLKSVSQNPVDVIIIPGIPYNGKSWNMIMKGRIYWAKYLYDMGYTKMLIFSGAAVHSQYIESRIMAIYSEAIGINPDSIILEESAEHSTENVSYSYKIAKQKGFRRIGLASDPFQSKLLSAYIKKNISNEIVMIPIVYDVLRKIDKKMTDPSINPNPALVKNFTALKKRSSFKQRIKGTLGANANLE